MLPFLVMNDLIADLLLANKFNPESLKAAVFSKYTGAENKGTAISRSKRKLKNFCDYITARYVVIDEKIYARKASKGDESPKMWCPPSLMTFFIIRYHRRQDIDESERKARHRGVAATHDAIGEKMSGITRQLIQDVTYDCLKCNVTKGVPIIYVPDDNPKAEVPFENLLIDIIDLKDRSCRCPKDNKKKSQILHIMDQYTAVSYTHLDVYKRQSVYSAIESSSATTVYVAGTPGVGKTLTVREVIKDLMASAKQEELPKFQYVEINGLKMVKPTDSYEVLWNKISGERLTWGASMESLEFYFNKVPKGKKYPIVVLLDELDALVTKNQEIMYNFFNWTTYQNAKLIVIAVANTMDLPERQLGNKVSSRIGFTRIMFTGYTHEELKNIIEFRLSGFNDTYFCLLYTSRCV